MGIDVHWVNERRESKQEVFDPRNYLSQLATSVWPGSQFTCLRFIDPWGETIFNQAQIPVLLDELQSFERVHTDSEIKAHLRKVVRLVERAVARTHTYIEFVGE